MPVEIQRVARRAGIRRDASLEAVERRRLQLWAVMSALLVAVSLLVAVPQVWTGFPAHAVISPSVLQVGMVALSIAFAVYVYEKERVLRRVTRLLMEEQVLRANLDHQVRRLHALVEAGRDLTGTLDVHRVVDLLLDHALDLFESSSGSVFVRQGDTFRVLATRSDSGSDTLDLAEGVARRVMADRDPVLTSERDDDGVVQRRSMSVPLAHDERVVGVLTITVDPEREVGELDLSVLESFGEHAAVALVNAQRFSERPSQAVDYDEFTSVSREFRWLSTA